MGSTKQIKIGHMANCGVPFSKYQKFMVGGQYDLISLTFEARCEVFHSGIIQE